MIEFSKPIHGKCVNLLWMSLWEGRIPGSPNLDERCSHAAFVGFQLFQGF